MWWHLSHLPSAELTVDCDMWGGAVVNEYSHYQFTHHLSAQWGNCWISRCLSLVSTVIVFFFLLMVISCCCIRIVLTVTSLKANHCRVCMMVLKSLLRSDYTVRRPWGSTDWSGMHVEVVSSYRWSVAQGSCRFRCIMVNGNMQNCYAKAVLLL